MTSSVLETTDPTLESVTARIDGFSEPIGCIDMDRFCDDCGYNLRTLPVRRDSRTGIPVVRCTECGRYRPANDASTAQRLWLNKVTAVALWLWILTIASVIVLLFMAEVGLGIATLEELTRGGGYTIERIGNTTTRTWTTYAEREVNGDFEDYELFIAVVIGTSLLTAFACAVFAVVVLPHWPRAAYAALMLAMPVLAACIATIAWRYEAQHLLSWSLPYTAGHLGAQVFGGILGILVGRPIARLTVRILLPPSVRPRLAYLWHADGKPFPRPQADPALLAPSHR